MGKRGNRKQTERTGASKVKIAVIILSLSVFLGCHVRRTIPESRIIYSGSFAFLECSSQKKTGMWKAIESNGKIKEIRLYSKFGIPVAVLKIKEGKIIYKNKPYENPFWEEIIRELPLIAKGKVKQIKKKDLEILAENGTIIVLAPFGWSKIRIEKINKRLP